ncbi:ankyrin repeat domain-containing protein [Kiritimatiella glycovorans]|uniref:Ankyrin-like protein n=1 Tax=Kiritimatiella glycovorans TaxID=1307763 RepID=A0A0G3EIL9_9BACT|nr:ankyrin repeat domain-containing protein [Kiritimatiella glycovorans]AKJ63989.1 ankyrin-like protein [Kiritimatiella glycovorans]
MNMHPSVAALIACCLCLGLAQGCGRDTAESSPPPQEAEKQTYTSTQLAEAAFRGEAGKVRTMLKSGLEADGRDEQKRTPLMLASFNGHVETLRILLKAGADPDAKDINDRTPLMFASTGAFPEAVRLLLRHGADVNAVDGGEHWSPLMFAAGEGHEAVVDVLLEHGADPSLKDADGDTAADFARDRGHVHLARKIGAGDAASD